MCLKKEGNCEIALTPTMDGSNCGFEPPKQIFLVPVMFCLNLGNKNVVNYLSKLVT